MKYASQIVCLLFLVALSSTSFGMMHMFTRKPRPLRQYQQLSPQQQRMIQTKALTTTIQSSPSFYSQFQKKFTELKAAGWNIWTRLTSRPSQAPVITSPQSITLQQPLAEPLRPSVQIIPSIPTAIDKSEISILSQLQTAQTLSEMDLALKNNAKTEQNKQQKLLNISNEQWLAMLKKEEEDFAWIKNNCFKNKNVISDDRNKIPKERYAQIIQCFKTTKLDPLSVKLVWETITTPDIFGHNAIITNGPIVNDSTTKLQQIPTITFDPDKVNALSPEEFDAALYHAITHLTQGHHNKLKNLENTVTTEKLTQYIQSPDGKNYIEALEATADFAMPIENIAVANIAKESAIEHDCDTLLNNIEKKLNTIKPTRNQFAEFAVSEVKESVEKIFRKSIIKCPNPTEEIQHLLKIQSLSTYEKYVKSKKRSLLKKMGFTKEERNTLEYLINSNIAQFTQQYKKPQNIEHHDKALYTNQLNLAKYLLKTAGIEPSSVPIRSTERNPQLLTLGGGITIEYIDPKKPLRDLNNISTYVHQILNLKPDPHNDDATTFVIAHEIGHIVKGHMIERLIIRTSLGAKYNIGLEETLKRFNNLLNKLDALCEIEADIWYATTNQRIAEIARDSAVHEVMGKNIYPDIYLTPANKLYVLTKILQLHEKSATKEHPDSGITKE